MTTDTAASATLAFAEKLFMLLDEGRRTATYKYAVLLGLMDLCLEGSSAHGTAPESVTTAQLARKVTALYWPQTVPFPGGGQRVLRQNKGGQGEILKYIEDTRFLLPGGPQLSYNRARLAHPRELEKLERNVEFKLVEMPLPRLQLLGTAELPFIYRIHWSANVRRSEFNDASSFDNRILFVEGAADHLARLAPLLRPLIQRQWAAMVAQLNQLPDTSLEEHLFGRERVPLAEVAQPLRELQERRCLYCGDLLPAQFEVDHFIPWSRHPDDGLDNLVAAHERCNGDKRDFLASAQHVSAWRERNRKADADLKELSRELQWERTVNETLGSARAIYLRLTDDVRLWHLHHEFVSVDRSLLQAALT